MGPQVHHSLGRHSPVSHRSSEWLASWGSSLNRHHWKKWGHVCSRRMAICDYWGLGAIFWRLVPQAMSSSWSLLEKYNSALIIFLQSWNQTQIPDGVASPKEGRWKEVVLLQGQWLQNRWWREWTWIWRVVKEGVTLETDIACGTNLQKIAPNFQ